MGFQIIFGKEGGGGGERGGQCSGISLSVEDVPAEGYRLRVTTAARPQKEKERYTYAS